MQGLQIVGRWISESNNIAKKEYDALQRQIDIITLVRHDCIMELVGVCPNCEEFMEYHECIREEMQDIKKCFINYTKTCRDYNLNKY